MRWLLLKDLQILRRSPLQAVLLVAYPILIAVLVGFAISGGPSKPRVAFLNEVPESSRINVGGQQLPAAGVGGRICKRVVCVRVANREEAEAKVRSGDVLAGLILPADLVNKINSLSTLSPGKPEVEVLLNEDDPLKSELVKDRINSLLAQANLAIARRIAAEGSHYLQLLIDGGRLPVLGESIQILGLRATAQILSALEPALPPGPLRASLKEVTDFATQARDNLDIATPLIQRLAQPIAVDRVAVGGSSPPLEIFAIAVAATLTLAFVAVLLVAGSLALEREENAFPRLTRGLVSREALLAEKIVLGVVVGLVVTLLLLAGLAIFVPLEWSRIGLWLAAIVLGGAALAAAGAALGAAAREVRAVSLLAFMVTLPVAFLSLVPAGSVGSGVYDAIKVVTALFPFKPALQAMTAALDSAGPEIGGPLLHLVILAVAYGLIARFALRRFASV
ncbi:MAG: type transport system permease protein [Solirubrobacterales bacterium]|jgi:ABC-2 type transport system permease protein|nr:type transport system permease protein [Solirubrobacterales bacterium]